MKDLESFNKRPDAAVDEILAELRAKSGQPPKPMDSELDKIMAELRNGTAAQSALSSVAPAPKVVAAPKPVAQPAPMAAPPKVAAAPKPVAQPAPMAAPTSPSLLEGSTLLERAAVSETRRLPILGDPSNLNPMGPRTGKAAAVERVEQDKFVGDEQLASWFSQNDAIHTSRRAVKMAEKARKKQQKEDEKELRRSAPTPEEMPVAPPRTRAAVAPPEGGGAALREVFEEIQQPSGLPPRPGRQQPALPDEGLSLFEFAQATAPLVPPAPVTATPAARPAPTREPAPPPAPPEEPKRPPGERTLAFQAIRGAVEEKLSGSEPNAGKSQMFKAQQAVQAETGKDQAFLASDAGKTQAFAASTVAAEAAKTQAFAAGVASDAGKTQAFAASAVAAEAAKTQAFTAGVPAVGQTQEFGKASAQVPTGKDTKQFTMAAEEERRVPTAAYTQEFAKEQLTAEAAAAAASAAAGQASAKTMGQGPKNLFVDEMVDDKFRAFFGETVSVDQADPEEEVRPKRARRSRKNRTALLTGEFAKLAEAAEEENEENFDDYSNPQDAEQVEADLVALRKTLGTRSILSGAAALLLFWMAFGYTGVLPLPAFVSVAASPMMFSMVYLALVVGVIVLNFTTVASGLIGLFGEPTVDTTGAIAAVAALLQGVVLLVQLLTDTAADVTLFGTLAALLLCFNSLGKMVRSTAILENFRLASGGLEHSAAYVVDGGQEVAFNITKGLEEEHPSILISRPTALVKGFLRQSFSMRWSDQLGKVLGWVLLGVCLVAAVIAYITTKDIMQAITCLAATACIGAPLSATLLSGVPSRLLQQGSGKLGAVVPGWSAIEELRDVNVVMAGARDIFPPQCLCLKGIKTFEQERIDMAILYASSILVEGCDTMREIFMGVIQGKQDMLFKVENLMCETGRGFMGFVDNSRVLVGTREMMQMHDIDPPPLELEMKFTADGCMPLYLAVSGKLFAMFLVAYGAEAGVQGTLEGLVRSGLSVLVTSDDPNVSNELIERVYRLPKGVVKVLGRRELSLLEPLRSYLPESDGVMTHIGTFTSFIGGMRAAAGCAAGERMSAIVQAAGVGLACLLCLLLAVSGGLSILSLSIVLLYQLGWALLVSILPFARRY